MKNYGELSKKGFEYYIEDFKVPQVSINTTLNLLDYIYDLFFKFKYCKVNYVSETKRKIYLDKLVITIDISDYFNVSITGDEQKYIDAYNSEALKTFIKEYITTVEYHDYEFIEKGVLSRLRENVKRVRIIQSVYKDCCRLYLYAFDKMVGHIDINSESFLKQSKTYFKRDTYITLYNLRENIGTSIFIFEEINKICRNLLNEDTKITTVEVSDRYYKVSCGEDIMYLSKEFNKIKDVVEDVKHTSMSVMDFIVEIHKRNNSVHNIGGLYDIIENPVELYKLLLFYNNWEIVRG